MADFTIKKGDLLPTLTAVCKDATGAAVSLAAATSVTFRMVSAPDGLTIAVNAAATPNPDQSNNPGQWTYTWQGSDTATPGHYYGECKVVWAGKTETFPNDGFIDIQVSADV